MNESTILGQMNQVDRDEIGALVRGFMRQSVRESLLGLIADEVSLLCGPKHQPAGKGHRRSGRGYWGHTYYLTLRSL